MSEIKVQHNGTEIVYDEKREAFVFVLRGRERAVPSLKQAKEIIDRPMRVKKESTFERQDCYLKRGYSDQFTLVTATSIATNSYSGGVDVWISYKEEKGFDGYRTDREKVSISCLYPVNSYNDARIAEWKAANEEKEEIKKEMEAICKRLKPLKAPKGEEKENG